MVNVTASRWVIFIDGPFSVITGIKTEKLIALEELWMVVILHMMEPNQSSLKSDV